MMLISPRHRATRVRRRCREPGALLVAAVPPLPSPSRELEGARIVVALPQFVKSCQSASLRFDTVFIRYPPACDGAGRRIPPSQSDARHRDNQPASRECDGRPIPISTEVIR